MESRGDAIKRYLSGRILAPIEGIWIDAKNSHELAIFRATSDFKDYCDFVGVYVDGRSSKWRSGEVKLWLTEAATPGLYNATFLSSYRSASKVWATLNKDGVLRVDLRSMPDMNYVKIYPKGIDRGGAGTPSAGAGGMQVAGSGFMLTPAAVVTSRHIVEGSRSISVVIGPLTIAASVLLQDEKNDLVVLQLQSSDSTVSQMLRANTKCLPVREDPPVAGEKVFSLGFPLASLVNSDLVITEGLISSASGPNGDPSILQTSAPVQPGSSGGPLIDQFGRVLGVVAASANSLAVLRETGALPQNVNFAVSTVPLRAMVKFLPNGECKDASTTAKPLTGQEIKSSCASAVVRVVAER